MKPQNNGAIVYEGPSAIDGSPIVVIVTGLKGRSRNAKTGAMLQAWIIRSDVHPIDAVRSGADESICGTCRHRGTKGKKRTCYVNLGQAPSVIFKALQRGIYPVAADAIVTSDWAKALPRDVRTVAEMGANRVVRLGAYGDPGAAPVDLWFTLVSLANAHTGYTHQWSYISAEFARLVMASADSPIERIQARAKGYRVFRVRTEAEPVEEREVICPASAEAGKKTNCFACRACGGTRAKAIADIVIAAHGAGKTTFNILAARMAKPVAAAA